MPVPERMSQVPPNRGRVTDDKPGRTNGESFDGKFASEKKQDPKRGDRDQKEFHAPECDPADEPEENKVAVAPDLFVLDDQKQNDQGGNEQKIECVAARLEMPLH